MTILVKSTKEISGLSWYFYRSANGNEMSVTNPLDQTTQYGYDAANRQTTITYALEKMVSVLFRVGEKKNELTPFFLREFVSILYAGVIRLTLCERNRRKTCRLAPFTCRLYTALVNN
jgi:YD repeat-containing protein